MSVTYRVDDKLAEAEAGLAADLHERAFRSLNAYTVQRHLMNRDELAGVFGDERIRKYTAWSDDGTLIGLSMQTCHLEAHPLVAPEFFERRWPDLYARQAIWYITSVCVDVGVAPHSVFPALVRQMMQPIRATRGMGVLDYSSYIMSTRHLDVASRHIIAGCAPLAEAEDIGSQHHVAYTFDWDKERA